MKIQRASSREDALWGSDRSGLGCGRSLWFSCGSWGGFRRELCARLRRRPVLRIGFDPGLLNVAPFRIHHPEGVLDAGYALLGKLVQPAPSCVAQRSAEILLMHQASVLILE